MKLQCIQFYVLTPTSPKSFRDASISSTLRSLPRNSVRTRPGEIDCKKRRDTHGMTTCCMASLEHIFGLARQTGVWPLLQKKHRNAWRDTTEFRDSYCTNIQPILMHTGPRTLWEPGYEANRNFITKLHYGSCEIPAALRTPCTASQVIVRFNFFFHIPATSSK